MNDSGADSRRTGAALAGRAANWALGMAIASITFAGVGMWLAVSFGLIPFLLCVLGWALCLAIGLGFAMGALKLSYGGATPGQARKKAWGAIWLSAFSLVLVVLYIFALAIAVQQLAQ